MQQQIKRLLFVAFFLFSFLTINFSTVQADAVETNEAKSIITMKEETSNEDDVENETPNGVSGCAGYLDDEKEQCEEDRKATVSTANFMAKAMLSLDNAIAEQELNKDYIKNFENSSTTAVSYAINLIDPETIIMWIINIVTSIFEKIGMLISLIVMILYNVASSSFIQTVIRNVFTTLDKIVFDWSNPNSYIYKLLFLFGMVAILYRLFESKKQVFTLTRFLNLVVMTVASCAVIVLIGMYGKPFVTNVEMMVEDSLTQTFSLEENKDVPLEIQTKEMLFENLQMKSFRLRHFGVTEASEIKGVNGVENEQRVQTLLNDPSVANAKIERKVYKSTDISYNFVICLKVLGLSLIFIIHRLLLSIIFGAGALLLILLVLMKEVLLGISVFAVIFTLLKRNKSTWSWFLNRFQWAILCVLANSFYAIFLYLISYLVDESIANGGIILMIVIDIALLFMGRYVIKKAPQWLERFLSDFNVEGQGLFQITKGIFTGDFSPKDIYDNHKQRKVKDDNQSDTEETETKINDTAGMSDDASLMDKSEDLYEDENKISDDEISSVETDENDFATEKGDKISSNIKRNSEFDNKEKDTLNEKKNILDMDAIEDDIEYDKELQNDPQVADLSIQDVSDSDVADINDLDDKKIDNSTVNANLVNESCESKVNVPLKDNNKSIPLNGSTHSNDISYNIEQPKKMNELPEEGKDNFFDELEWDDLDL